MIQKRISRLLAIAVCLLPTTLSAQESTTAARENQELQSRIDRLEFLVEQFRNSENSGQPLAVGMLTDIDSHFVEPASFSTRKLDGRPESAPPTYPTVKLTGFFQTDAGWFSQSDRNPFGLDGLTSVKELTFLERGLPLAFLPFRQIGVMAKGISETQDSTWAVSGFRFPTDPFGSNVGDNGGYGLAICCG